VGKSQASARRGERPQCDKMGVDGTTSHLFQRGAHKSFCKQAGLLRGTKAVSRRRTSRHRPFGAGRADAVVSAGPDRQRANLSARPLIEGGRRHAGRFRSARSTQARGSFLAGARPAAAVPPCRSDPHHHARRMFVITEAVAAASRAAFDRGGKLSAVVLGRFQVKLANKDMGQCPGRPQLAGIHHTARFDLRLGGLPDLEQPGLLNTEDVGVLRYQGLRERQPPGEHVSQVRRRSLAQQGEPSSLCSAQVASLDRCA
jgi:hypothetical protein